MLELMLSLSNYPASFMPSTPSAAALHQALKTYFGYDSFRDKQQEIIENVLAGNDALVIMPTGGGKSICFQLPALLLSGITIVISPLIALMKDQVEALQQNGIAADFYHSLQTPEARQSLYQALNARQLKLIYTAPESLEGLLNIIPHQSIIIFKTAFTMSTHCIDCNG